MASGQTRQDGGPIGDDNYAAFAEAAVSAAIEGGAQYADARVRQSQHRSFEARNGDLVQLGDGDEIGIGVRALVGSSWGFQATDQLDDESIARAGRDATAVARASRAVPGTDLEFADIDVGTYEYETPVDHDPFDVSVADHANRLVAATETMHAVAGVVTARASTSFWAQRQWFASSQGHRITQRIVQTGGGIDATAVNDNESQRRSYPQSFGQFEAGGYEVIEALDLNDAAGRVAEEAVALLSAPECPSGTTDVILDGSQVALQIHESVGHAIELDRILGWEAAFAGTSFLELSELGRLRYGSPLMNITADATIPGALSTFGFDDEGTPAQSVDIVNEGVWVGVLSGRDSAHLAGVPPGGMVRCDGYNRLPMVRMTNVGLRPGDASLAEIISDTADGIYMDTNRSWSIDDKRLNFQFGCEVAWEVKGGKRGRMLRNPTYTGITPQFWASLDRLAGAAEWRPWGVPNCGKGQPMQVARTGHPAAPARFRNVRTGVRG